MAQIMLRNAFGTPQIEADHAFAVGVIPVGARGKAGNELYQLLVKNSPTGVTSSGWFVNKTEWDAIP